MYLNKRKIIFLISILLVISFFAFSYFKTQDIKVVDGDTIYTSGREGIFEPGIAIGKIKTEKDQVNVLLFSDLSQITFVNISLGDLESNK